MVLIQFPVDDYPHHRNHHHNWHPLWQPWQVGQGLNKYRDWATRLCLARGCPSRSWMRHEDGVEWGSLHTLCLCSAGFVGKKRNSFSRAVIQAPFTSSIFIYISLILKGARNWKNFRIFFSQKIWHQNNFWGTHPSQGSYAWAAFNKTHTTNL